MKITPKNKKFVPAGRAGFMPARRMAGVKPALPKELQRLVEAAFKAAKNSYSPYSRFPVGAALMTTGGKVFTGCNVENASYGLTMCAERVAVMSAVAAGQKKFQALAVAGGNGRAVRPCGACLQVLSEFCGPEFPIYLAPLKGRSRSKSIECVALRDLLPQTFSL